MRCKGLWAALAVLLALSMAACGGQAGQSSAPSIEEHSSSQEEASQRPAEYYDELRAESPYREKLWDALKYEEIIPTDDTGREILRLLARIGDPGEETGGPEGFSQDFILNAALFNSALLETQSESAADPAYAPELRPIAEELGHDYLLPREHVDETARRLFGQAGLAHQDYWLWQYHSLQGVYTPPYAGTPLRAMPVLLGYEAADGGYRAEVAYLPPSMEGGYLDGEGQPVPPGEEAAYAATLPRRQVEVKTAQDGSLYLYSHRYL